MASSSACAVGSRRRACGCRRGPAPRLGAHHDRADRHLSRAARRHGPPASARSMGRAALLVGAPSASFATMRGKVGGKRDERQGPRKPKPPTIRTQAAKANRPHAKSPGANTPIPKTAEPMRIAKAIAHAGLCSRRDAERMIEDGRVAVNGKVLTTPAHVVAASDKIIVDGKPLPQAEAPRLWRYHKPRGLVTSHKDPQGRKTVFEALPAELPRVVSVGRLDINTEGLLLLTTDGALARHLELPSTGWLRRYRVRAHGRVTQEALDALREGITIDGDPLRAGRGADRPRARRQSLAHARASRRQEPRGEAARRASRPHREPADPRLVRAVRARRSRRGRGRGGEAEGAGRSAGRQARRRARPAPAAKLDRQATRRK